MRTCTTTAITTRFAVSLVPRRRRSRSRHEPKKPMTRVPSLWKPVNSSCRARRFPPSASAAGWKSLKTPTQPDGRQIRIRVARIPARDRLVEPDPLVFFAGGPGQAATETWPVVAHALRKVNENRDILLVDQRGTGQSNALKCPEIELDEALAADWDELARTTRECLEAVDGDPRFYTTTIAMHDIDAARAALGYDQVNLYRRLLRHPCCPGLPAPVPGARAHGGAGRRRAPDPGAGHRTRRKAGPGAVPRARRLRCRPGVRQSRFPGPPKS